MLEMMPEGFDMSLEQIGKGKPALVFVYDPNLSISIDQSEELNKARAQLNDQVLFLVANLGTPEGDQMIASYRAVPAELLLFDPFGRLAKRQLALKHSNQLIEWIGGVTP